MQTSLGKLHSGGSAKIMRPSASRIVKRKRLFRQLEARRECPLIWISGPAGSGKSTLVSSFIEDSEIEHLWYKLDSNDADVSSFFFNMTQACKLNGHKRNNLPVFSSDYRLGIPEFSHNYFGALFNNFTGKSLIVMDNYQELPEDLIFHDLLIDSLNLLPETIKIIIISRKEPSTKFSRLIANRRINQLGWHDLRFTPDEFFDVVCSWGFEDLPQRTQDHIYKKMDGWITGLLFMLDGTKKYNTNLQNIGIGTFEEIFNYFSEETFDYQDKDVKSFLMHTSQLTQVTPELAQIITGEENAARILSCMDRNNLFIQKLASESKEIYQYHPLFQEYLKVKLNEHFAQDKVAGIKRKTADLLLIENQVEKAAELLLNAGDYLKFIEVVASQAANLISQGRYTLLAEWLAEIPPEKFLENPCLSFWYGTCRQHTDPASAKEHFRKAFEVSCKQKNMECAFASWAGLTEAIIHQWHDFTELDPLIAWFNKHFPKLSAGLPGELRGRVRISMAESLLVRDPGSPFLVELIENAIVEAQTANSIELSLQANLVAANYYLWSGNQSQCWVILSQIRKLARSPQISTLYALKSKCLEATMYAWYMTDAEKSLKTVEDALDIGLTTGVHLVDHSLYVTGAFAALLAGSSSKLADYIQKVESMLDKNRQHCFFCHHYLSAWFSITRGNILRGATHANEALQTAEKTGHIFHKALGRFVIAQVFYEKGEFTEALAMMDRFGDEIQNTKSSLLLYMFNLSKAHFLIDLGKEEEGVQHLDTALKIGKEERYQNIHSWWCTQAMTILCLKALEKKIEIKYAREVIKGQGIIPPDSPIEIEQWPWPLKIYTLGRFEIVKDGEPVRFTGKAQQKPLAMLKALIALGGRGVSESYLADSLWPDADGDMQHQSIATTLHRLRKILGGKHVIDFQDGYLNINSNYVWVDVWAFERLLSLAEKELNKDEPKSVFFASKYAEKAIVLYKGGFLDKNISDHWCIRLRERLKSRFMRGVTLLGRCYEKLDQAEKAIDCYLFALEVDSMMEEFYQRLMICYHRLDRDADAVLVFKRCQKTLQNQLQVSPSSHTRSIYKNLLSRPTCN